MSDPKTQSSLDLRSPLDPEVVEDDDLESGRRAKYVEDPSAVKALTAPFEDALLRIDKARGSNLADTFRQCYQMHNNNALLRQNLHQMQVMLQAHMQDWADIRAKAGRWIDDLDPKREDFHSQAKLFLELNERTALMIQKMSTTIRDVRREIRQTEFADQFHFHVSIVQQFVTGMKAILFRHLQSDPKLDAILNDIKNLAKIFRLQQQ